MSNQAHYDDVNIPNFALVGVLGTALTFLAIVGIEVMFLRYHESVVHVRQTLATTRRQDAVLDAQRAQLEESGWIDRSSGKAAIPIERAMEIVAREVAAPDA